MSDGGHTHRGTCADEVLSDTLVVHDDDDNIPGWPEFAFATTSAARARMVAIEISSNWLGTKDMTVKEKDVSANKANYMYPAPSEFCPKMGRKK